MRPAKPQNQHHAKITLDQAYRRARYWKYMPMEEVETMTFEERRERAEILKTIRRVEKEAGVVF